MIKSILINVLLLISITLGAQNQTCLKNNGHNDLSGSAGANMEKALYKLYSPVIDPSIELINGTEYFPYYYLSNSKPVLFFGRKHSGSVTVNGRRYNDISLDYDTYTNKVIYIDSGWSYISKPLKIALDNDNVDCFELWYPDDTLTFRYFADSDSSFNLQKGYYEVVYDKRSTFLINHNSSTYISNGIIEYNYNPVYYVDLGNGFTRIKSGRQFIRMFDKMSGEVKRFSKKSGTKIHRNDKQQIMSILRFYDTLKNSIN